MRIPDPKNNLEPFARYSGMAVQMMAIIVLGVFGGYKLDIWLETRPILTVILSLLSVVTAIYLVTRDLLKKKGNK